MMGPSLTGAPSGASNRNMRFAASFVAVFFLSASIASAEPPSVEQVLSRAKAKASAERKTIFLHFDASSCGWCKRLDAFLERPDTKPVFEKHFIAVKLVVQESEKNKALENPGGEAVLKELGGPAGLPYSALLDAQGKLIAAKGAMGLV